MGNFLNRVPQKVTHDNTKHGPIADNERMTSGLFNSTHQIIDSGNQIKIRLPTNAWVAVVELILVPRVVLLGVLVHHVVVGEAVEVAGLELVEDRGLDPRTPDVLGRENRAYQRARPYFDVGQV